MQALIPLALEGTDVGKVKAAHALAKVARSPTQTLAFPGSRWVARVRAGGDGRSLLPGTFLISPPLAWEGMVPSQRGR